MAIKQIEKDQVLDRIRFENPWWLSREIEKDYNAMPRRLYFELFKPLVEQNDIRRAVVLMGPRRVGKTVMLHHTVQHLLSTGVPARKIIFITIENPIYNNMLLEQLYRYAKEASGLKDSGGWYVIFDEIQYCRDWEVHLKVLVDSYRQDKFIVSGSAAAALKIASAESGAGRFTDFKLPPLTFNEYLALKGLDNMMIPVTIEWQGIEAEFHSATHLSELNKHFIDYINFGGYPEVIFSPHIQQDPGRYIRQDIVDKVLLRDLPSLYGISDTRELNSLFTTIAWNSGAEFSLESLSQQSQVQKNTLKRYIDYLEAAYLIRKVRRIDQSGKQFKRDNFFKIYLTNPSLRSALFSPIDSMDSNFGAMAETAVFAQWMHRDWITPWYSRWKGGEVDMVGLGQNNLKPVWALEIKWTNRYFEKPAELKSLIRFCKENDLNNPVVTTIDKTGDKEVDGVNVQFLPSAAYAYTVGHRSFKMKKT